MAERRWFTITCVRRDPAGFFRARVTAGGVSLDVDDQHGSWLASVRVRKGARTFRRCDVKREVAAALQARVAPLRKTAATTGRDGGDRVAVG